MIHFAIAAMSLALLDPAAAARPSEAPQPAPAAKPASSANTRYCTIVTHTGSILRTRTCHTRSEWMERGFDPLARQ